MTDAVCSRVEEYKIYVRRVYSEMTDEAAGIIQVIGRATSWWEWILTTILDGSVA